MGVEVRAVVRQELRRRRHLATSRWHLDEMAVLIGGKRFWFWRAVDDEGEVLDLLVQRRRDAGRPRNLCADCLRIRASPPRRLSPTSSALMGRPGRSSAYRLAMSKACGRTNGPRIRICRCGDASGRCSVLNRPDQRNGSWLFTPSSRIHSTFSAILFCSVSSEGRHSRIGRQRQRAKLEPVLSDFRLAKAKFS